MSTSRYCHFVKRAAVRILGSARKRLNAIRMLRETLRSVHCVTLFGVLALAPLTAIADDPCDEPIKQVKAILGALNKAVAPKAKLGKFEVKRLSPPTKAGKFQVSYLIGSKPVFSQRLEQRPEISDHFFAASTSRKSSAVLELSYGFGAGGHGPVCDYEITRTPTQFVARRPTDPPFTSDRDGDGLPVAAQVVEPPFSPPPPLVLLPARQQPEELARRLSDILLSQGQEIATKRMLIEACAHGAVFLLRHFPVELSREISTDTFTALLASRIGAQGYRTVPTTPLGVLDLGITIAGGVVNDAIAIRYGETSDIAVRAREVVKHLVPAFQLATNRYPQYLISETVVIALNFWEIAVSATVFVRESREAQESQQQLKRMLDERRGQEAPAPAGSPTPSQDTTQFPQAQRGEKSTCDYTSVTPGAQPRIEGYWILRREGDPRGIQQTTMTFRVEGAALLTEGPGWRGEGGFDGSRGCYRWKFFDGRQGRTHFEMDAAGAIHGRVRGSGIDWDYAATRDK